MKRLLSIFLVCLLTILSCSEDNDDTVSQASVTFNFSHNWDGTVVTNTDFNTLKFTNENSEKLSIERLRYLISKITLTTNNNEKLVLNDYNLVDLTNSESLSFTPSTFIPRGSYSDVSFTFGFNNEDNSNNYADLNSASWFVPEILGGGYHYMQLDGKFINASD